MEPAPAERGTYEDGFVWCRGEGRHLVCAGEDRSPTSSFDSPAGGLGRLIGNDPSHAEKVDDGNYINVSRLLRLGKGRI